jgi:hypothetical protein
LLKNKESKIIAQIASFATKTTFIIATPNKIIINSGDLSATIEQTL